MLVNMPDRAPVRAPIPPTPIERLPIVSGSRCLDLVNTVVGFGTGTARDSLVDPAAFRRWAQRAGFAAGRGHGPEDRAAFDGAVALRSAIGWIAAGLCAGDRPPRDALAGLRQAATGAMARRRLVAGSDGLAWKATASGLACVLDELALEAVELLTGPGRAALRRCAADDCAWFFLDRSRNQSRRWCAMGDCGNRAKARRRRRREQGPAA